MSDSKENMVRMKNKSENDMFFFPFLMPTNLSHWKIHVPGLFRSLLIDQKQLCQNVPYFQWPGVLRLYGTLDMNILRQKPVPTGSLPTTLQGALQYVFQCFSSWILIICI